MARGRESKPLPKGRVELTVKLDLLESKDAKEIPKSVAYAYSAGGKLLASESIAAGKSAKLTLPALEEAQAINVVVGPEAGEKSVKLPDLMRRGGELRHVRIDPTVREVAVDFHVIPDKWRCWLLSICFVKGTLLKRQEVDGILVDFPVCNATVEVYEVDPLWLVIPRLPLDRIEWLRELLAGIRVPPVGPWPPIGPWPPEPWPPGPLLDLPGEAQMRMAGMAAMEKSDVPGAGEASRSVSAIENVRSLAMNTDAIAFRSVLIENAKLVAPYLCRYFPWVTKQKVAEAVTDECGRFQAAFFRGCANPDTPDLYFKATQQISGIGDVTIYEPKPVACHTHWNYQCGSEVTLYTSNPLARTCSPCAPVDGPDNWVLVMAIGNLPLSRIRGTSTTAQPTTNAGNLGLNFGIGESPTFDGRPFGGLLRLRMEFDNSLREHLGVRYYRVSYRKGTTGSFAALNGEVHRHYIYDSGGLPVIEGYPLGPKVINGVPDLFEIPPALPPHGQWSVPDAKEDLTSAKFSTVALAPAAEHGKYQLKVDLFDINGNLVNIDAIAGQQIRYVVPVNEDVSTPGTINTDDASSLGLVVDDDADGKESFIMTVHVDNNHCTADIGTPTLNGAAANDCGVLEYMSGSQNVDLPYQAQHPNGFATYTFSIKRGANTLPALTQSGTAVPPGNFVESTTVGDLLSADCPIAGFSEHLYVWAMATDGWVRLSGYDASNHRGLALAPRIMPGSTP